jgi:RNA polymerase sigma-70 factor (ECF subfamily)
VGTDDDTIRRAKAGEPGAWRELYVSHAGRLVVWLRSMPNADVATSPDDLAGEAWLIAAEKIGEFEGTESEFAGWLFGVGRHLAFNARRRSSRRATDPTASDAEELDSPVADSSDQVADLDWIRSVLDRLPQREREVVSCLDVVGLDVAATALALGLSRTAVRVAHHRGLARLRRLVPDRAALPLPD